MTQFNLPPTWTKIASAGDTVEVQVTGGAIKLTISGTVPAANADGENLTGGDLRKYDTPLPFDLYGCSPSWASIVEVLPVGSSVGSGSGGSPSGPVTANQGSAGSAPWPFERPPLTYATATGSPFALTSTWAKVATTTTATKGLRIAPLASATTYDIEWVAVAAGASAPTASTDPYGEPIFGGEDFASGLPIGDIYLKSASGQKAIVRTGA